MINETPKHVPADTKKEIDDCVMEQEKFISSSKNLPNMKGEISNEIDSAGEQSNQSAPSIEDDNHKKLLFDLKTPHNNEQNISSPIRKAAPQ